MSIGNFCVLCLVILKIVEVEFDVMVVVIGFFVCK